MSATINVILKGKVPFKKILDYIQKETDLEAYIGRYVFENIPIPETHTTPLIQYEGSKFVENHTGTLEFTVQHIKATLHYFYTNTQTLETIEDYEINGITCIRRENITCLSVVNVDPYCVTSFMQNIAKKFDGWMGIADYTKAHALLQPFYQKCKKE